MLLPDARFRSPTAVEGKADLRDENIYSALVLAHGGAGQQKVFTVPQGQAIPELKGSSITATTNAHQTTYTETTTNLTKAGELGASFGDASIRGIGVTIEQVGYDTSGAALLYGAGQQEVADILAKSFFQLKIAGKKQIEGPLWNFPASGGAFGSISTTETGVTAAVVSNGWPGTTRRLKLPIMVARNDTLEGVYGVAGGSSLVFSVTTSVGQPVLVWFSLLALILSKLAKKFSFFFRGPLMSYSVASAVAV